MCNKDTLLELKKQQILELHNIKVAEWNARSRLMNEIRSIYPWYTRRSNYWTSRPDYQQYEKEQDEIIAWAHLTTEKIHAWFIDALSGKEVDIPAISFPLIRLANKLKSRLE